MIFIIMLIPLNDNGGIRINNSSGNIVARFNNYSSNSIPIKSVEHSFTNLAGNGNNSYKIIIYGDNGCGKPGALLYSSPTLMSPAGHRVFKQFLILLQALLTFLQTADFMLV
ncbi:MAG: hypothetical protein IPG09_18310 [Ignavibacteria bacterium]|nr:hypothetical protein [Ignavibacteria bacterium]